MAEGIATYQQPPHPPIDENNNYNGTARTSIFLALKERILPHNQRNMYK